MSFLNRKSKHTLRPTKKHIESRPYNPQNVKSNKSITFNEDNIAESRIIASNHQARMNFSEIRTPYPKKDSAVNSIILRRKLMDFLGSVRSREARESLLDLAGDSISDFDIGNIIADSIQHVPTGRSHIKRQTFEEKRKKFYASEYILTKQRALSDVVHGTQGRQGFKNMGSQPSKLSFFDGSLHKYFSTDERDDRAVQHYDSYT